MLIYLNHTVAFVRKGMLKVGLTKDLVAVMSKYKYCENNMKFLKKVL